jgi:hypothetical protein
MQRRAEACLMRPWLKNLLLGCLVFTLCWGGALWYWRSNNTMPGSADVVLYLILLPVVVLFLLWFAKKLVLLAGAAPAVAAAPVAAPAPAPAPVIAPPLHLVAGALRLPHGQSAQEFREAVDAGEARPALDPELHDDHGFPVMSARVPGLDTAVTQQAMHAWLDAQSLPAPGFTDEQWRALALGADVVAELGQAAGAHEHLYGYHGATPTDRAATPLPMLQLLPLLPTGWDLGQRMAAGRWLLNLVQQQGWPAERLSLSAAAERGIIEPLALIAQLAQQGAAAGQPYVALVVACASHLGEETIDAWSSQGLLFTARNQRGQIPGEGAAGILLADATQAILFDAADAPQLHAAMHGAHGASTDGPGLVDSTLLSGLGSDALRGAASEGADVQLVVGDADHRGSRNGELLAAAGACAPQIDAATQVLGVAACCGQAGAVSALAALVLARQETLDNASHVLYLSNLDPHQRSAAVVRPPPESGAAAPAAAMAA